MVGAAAVEGVVLAAAEALLDRLNAAGHEAGDADVHLLDLEVAALGTKGSDPSV